MNLNPWLSFFGIAIIFELSIIFVLGQPSCSEFQYRIKNLDAYKPADGLNSLAVSKVAQNYEYEALERGECSLFNYSQNCGSIRIKGNIFENNAIIIISGWNGVPNKEEHYRLRVTRRSPGILHIYDFESTEIRNKSILNNDGIWHSWMVDYQKIPEHVRERLSNFTIALVAADTSDGMTGVGFRFCQPESDNDDLKNFFEQSGFVAFDTRQEDNYETIVNAVAASGGNLFNGFVDIPLDKWSD